MKWPIIIIIIITKRKKKSRIAHHDTTKKNSTFKKKSPTLRYRPVSVFQTFATADGTAELARLPLR